MTDIDPRSLAPLDAPMVHANWDAYRCGVCGLDYSLKAGHECQGKPFARASERPYSWLGCVVDLS